MRLCLLESSTACTSAFELRARNPRTRTANSCNSRDRVRSMLAVLCMELFSSKVARRISSSGVCVCVCVCECVCVCVGLRPRTRASTYSQVSDTVSRIET